MRAHYHFFDGDPQRGLQEATTPRMDLDGMEMFLIFGYPFFLGFFGSWYVIFLKFERDEDWIYFFLPKIGIHDCQVRGNEGNNDDDEVDA